MTLDGAPAPRGGGMSGWNKILIGCGLGCGCLVLLMVIAGGFATLWVFTPGEQIATERIVGDDSVGVARSGELAADPGTQELLTHVVQRLAEIDRAAQEAITPDSLKWLNQFQQEPNAEDLNTMIPSDVTFALERIDGSEEVDVVAALNFRAMVRPIAAMFSFAFKKENPELHHRHRGFDVYELEHEEGVVSWVDSTLVFATSTAAMHQALDRVLDRTPPPTASTPAAEVELEGDWDLAGRLRNDGDLLVDWLYGEGLEPPPTSEELELQFGVDIATGDTAQARFLITARDADEAAAWRPILEEGLRRLVDKAHGRDLETHIEISQDGDQVSADFEVRGIEEAVLNFMRPDAGREREEEGEATPDAL